MVASLLPTPPNTLRVALWNETAQVERAWIWRRALDAVLDHARRGQAGNATSTDPPTLSASEKVLVSKDSRAEVVNDTVMGGVSRSAWAGGTFYGHVTRERNGGFSGLQIRALKL